jgi:hypothetical protein
VSTSGTEPSSTRRRRSISRPDNLPAVVGLVAFLVILTTAWIVLTPFGGYPDDLDHYLRAAGVSEGQVVGTPVPGVAEMPVPPKSCCEPGPAMAYWVQSGIRHVDVPPVLEPERIPCGVAINQPRSDCTKDTTDTSTSYQTTMGTIEPSAYLLPGVAMAIVRDSSLSFRVARLANAVLEILALGLVLAGCARRPNFARRVAGFCLAATPMVAFVISSGSPNAFETAGAIGVWIAALELSSGSTDERAPATLWAGFLLSGLLLVTARSLGPVWLLGIVGLTLMTRRRRPLIAACRASRRWAVATVAVLAAGAVTTVVWEAKVQPHVALDAAFARGQLRPSFHDIPRVLHEVIGGLGNLDIYVPEPAAKIWVGLVLVMILVAVITGKGRERLTLIVLLAATFAAILAIDAGIMRQNGFAIQGRHVLAIFVGLPIVAVDMIRVPDRIARWLPLACGVFCAGLNLYAWAYAATSYVATPKGLVVTPAFSGAWSTTHPARLLLLAGAAALALVAATGWMSLWGPPRGDPAPADPPAPSRV